MKKLSLPILVLVLASQAGSLAVHSGVYNKLKQVNVTPDQYFDSEDVSPEEKSIQDSLAQKTAQEKLSKEAEAQIKEAEILKKAQDIRDQEINLLNEKFQAEKAAAGVEDKAAKPVKKRGFFSKVWRVITYPFRAIAKVF
jgi:D-alanyl-D-alanine carboxypeptidase